MRRLIFLLFSLMLFLWPGVETMASNSSIQDSGNEPGPWPRLEQDLLFLTDSTHLGRATGSASCQSVTFFLLREFKNAGLRTSVQSFDCGGRTGHNVIGVTQGWFRKYIVIGAYYDGLGVLDGTVYPCADSNASGVGALLSLACSLPEFCKGDTGIVFVAFDAHNAGLLGSKAFLESGMTNQDVTLLVNLDTMGSSASPLRQSRPDYLMALGGAEFFFGMDNANRGIGLDLGYDYYGSSTFTDLFYRKISDQRWFVENGIPSVMFTSGITMDTNKVTDTVQSLDIPVLKKRTTFIFKWIMSLIS
ncbi:MAG TPA: hypothetical protein DDX33_03625 [Rikenellaceae bacterium]|nr:hypothetical protein [Rikenellaceae bacterium]HBH21086.1 hypothetical protein [Rikenellaceae bacterium]